MVSVVRFTALRPKKSSESSIASVPYDVVSSEESRAEIEERPESFLSVIRSDAVLPEIPADDPRVYASARENLESMIARGLLVQDPSPGMYIYRVKQGGNIYTGLVANVSVDDYSEGRIKRHEHTRYDKEKDRTCHIDTTGAHTGLVVLLYRDPEEIFSTVSSLIPDRGPDSVVKTPSGVVHEIFRISDPAALDRIEGLFGDLGALYIADGHHRAKSSVNVAEKRCREGRGGPESERFMAVLFAHDRVRIHGYSRLVTDLAGYTTETFLLALKERYDVQPYGEIDDTVFCIPPLSGEGDNRHIFHMYLGGAWYELSCPVKNPDDPIESLDVSELQRSVMEDMLKITDPRGDPRLQYLGGARPLADLKKKVDSGEFAAAFSLQPVRIDDVLAIADEGGVMPPKSTWFEPKLLSGLTVHLLD